MCLIHFLTEIVIGLTHSIYLFIQCLLEFLIVDGDLSANYLPFNHSCQVRNIL